MWCQLVDGLNIGYKLTENNGDNMKFPLYRYDVMFEFDPSVLRLRPGEAYGSRAWRLLYDEPRPQSDVEILRFHTGMSLYEV